MKKIIVSLAVVAAFICGGEYLAMHSQPSVAGNTSCVRDTSNVVVNPNVIIRAIDKNDAFAINGKRIYLVAQHKDKT